MRPHSSASACLGFQWQLEQYRLGLPSFHKKWLLPNICYFVNSGQLMFESAMVQGYLVTMMIYQHGFLYPSFC